MNPSDISILNIKGSDYCCIISLISKTEAIKSLQNANLTEKSGTLWNIKIGKEILTFGNIEITPIFWDVKLLSVIQSKKSLFFLVYQLLVSIILRILWKLFLVY